MNKLKQGSGPENDYKCLKTKSNVSKIKPKFKILSKCFIINCVVFQKYYGSIRLNHFELKKTFTFLDYIMSGTQINCTFAIDFTGMVKVNKLYLTF